MRLTARICQPSKALKTEFLAPQGPDCWKYCHDQLKGQSRYKRRTPSVNVNTEWRSQLALQTQERSSTTELGQPANSPKVLTSVLYFSPFPPSDPSSCRQTLSLVRPSARQCSHSSSSATAAAAMHSLQKRHCSSGSSAAGQLVQLSSSSSSAVTAQLHQQRSKLQQHLPR